MVKTEWSLVTADAREANRARTAIRAFLARRADAARSDLDAAELIVGELVANEVAFRFGWSGTKVCVCAMEGIRSLCSAV